MYIMYAILFVMNLFLYGADIGFEKPVMYEQGKVACSDAFYSEYGWGREPLTRHLTVSGTIVGSIFPEAREELSTLAQIDDVAIGHCNANWWQSDWLEKLPNNLNKVLTANSNDSNIQKFVDILFAVFENESFALKTLFASQNIPLNKVAHNAGLMVLQDYGQRGIGAMLFEQNLVLLEQQGAVAVVVETTNRFSAQIMQKRGFIKFKAFSYKDDFDVAGLDDYYTVWYKILKK